MPIKIAMIGAGSIGFTRRLMRDILAVPELADTVFHFTDISERNLDMVSQLCRRDMEASGVPAKLVSTMNRREAIADADYVISTIRQGGLEAFQTDIDIPLKYGVDQCVGDTLCAGGIMYAQRTILELLDFCKDIREVAKPGRHLPELLEPDGDEHLGLQQVRRRADHRPVPRRAGRALADHPLHRAVGQEGRAARPPDETLHRRDVDVIAAGLNHQTWFIKVQWRGMDMVPRLLELFEAHPEYSQTEKIRIDVLRRFGYYSTESNGHLSEYVPWYRKRTDEIQQWIDLSVVDQRRDGRLSARLHRGAQLVRDRLPALAAGAAVGSLDLQAQRGARLLHHRGAGDRPAPIAGTSTWSTRATSPTCRTAAWWRSPATWTRPASTCRWWATCRWRARRPAPSRRACRRWAWKRPCAGDVTLLKQAMLHDPLAAAVCNPEEIWQMTDEMLVAQAQWLPQFAAEIPAGQAPAGGSRAHRQACAPDRDAGRGAPAHQDRRRDGRQRRGRRTPMRTRRTRGR